jgi:hypothetical protein
VTNTMGSGPDCATAIITGAVRKVLSDVQQRCAEGLKALDQGDYLVSLGAMIGLEDQIRSINARLLVLWEIAEYTNKNEQKGGSK